VVVSSIAADVAAVDAFWADTPKSLSGPPPEFGPSTFNRRDQYEQEAKWPIADSIGIVRSAHLRIVVRPGLAIGPSISVIFNRQAIARVDFVPGNECESNPLWAADLGLPPRVCGPHFHSWEHNRSQILATGDWELQCRLPLTVQIRRFEQAFAWLAAEMNLVLTPDQRAFDVPPQLL